MDSAKKAFSAVTKSFKVLTIDPGPGIDKQLIQSLQSPVRDFLPNYEDIDTLITLSPERTDEENRRVTRALFEQRRQQRQLESRVDDSAAYLEPRPLVLYQNTSTQNTTHTQTNTMDLPQMKVVLHAPVSIPIFTGEANQSISEYLETYVKLSKINDWDDDQMTERLCLYLQGTALRALQNILKNDHQSWSDIVTGLKRVFRDIDEKGKAKERLYACKQKIDQSSLVHAENIIYLADQYKSGMSDKKLIDIIWKSLLPSVADKLVAKEAKTLDEFKALLANIEEGIAKYNCTLRNAKSEREVLLEQQLIEAEAKLNLMTLKASGVNDAKEKSRQQKSENCPKCDLREKVRSEQADQVQPDPKVGYKARYRQEQQYRQTSQYNNREPYQFHRRTWADDKGRNYYKEINRDQYDRPYRRGLSRDRPEWRDLNRDRSDRRNSRWDSYESRHLSRDERKGRDTNHYDPEKRPRRESSRDRQTEYRNYRNTSYERQKRSGKNTRPTETSKNW